MLVVDFGAQYAQLIARRVREARIYSEVVPHTATAAEIEAKNPVAIVLSGGPASVYADGAPSIDPGVFDLGLPMFGICYGFQVMAQALGGEVAKTGSREYGRTEVTVDDLSRIIVLCLRHRLRKDPMETIDSGDKVKDVFMEVFGLEEDEE